MDRYCHFAMAAAKEALPENKGKPAFLGRVHDARFKRQVVPGDVVEMELCFD